jgi:hypothetical protein
MHGGTLIGHAEVACLERSRFLSDDAQPASPLRHGHHELMCDKCNERGRDSDGKGYVNSAWMKNEGAFSTVPSIPCGVAICKLSSGKVCTNCEVLISIYRVQFVARYAAWSSC